MAAEDDAIRERALASAVYLEARLPAPVLPGFGCPYCDGCPPPDTDADGMTSVECPPGRQAAQAAALESAHLDRVLRLARVLAGWIAEGEGATSVEAWLRGVE